MAPHLPKTVLFDLDGTLVDNFEAIHRCYDDVMQMMGLPGVTLEQIRRAVGGSVNVTVVKLAGEANAPTATRLFREHFPDVMFHGLKMYPGCVALLEALKAQQIQTAVYTNKDEANSKKILEHLNIRHLVDNVFGTNVHPWRKPQPEFTHHVLTQLQAQADQTVMVGDSPFDISTARQGGLARIHCVTTGSHTAEELEPYKPDTIHADLTQIGQEVFRVL
jgi:phosphoglycolate phosphatase